MSQVIKIDSGIPFFDVQAQLDGVTYTLQCRWNVRLGAWFMDVLDETGTTQIISGLRLVCNWPLGAYNTGRNPPGAFVLIDTTGNKQDPGINDLGDRCQLTYWTKADLGL